MKKRGGVWPGLLLALPFLDIALLRMIVFSIRDGRPETGLFAVFYLQFVPQEILLRSILGKKKAPGWRYWAGWICRWSGILAGVLSIPVFLNGGGWKALYLPGLYECGHWTAMALIPLRWIFVLSGTVILLGSRETRKKALLLALAAFPVLMMAFAIVGTQPSVSGNRDLTNLLGSVTVLLIPHLYGVWGAQAGMKPGKTAAEGAGAAKRTGSDGPAAKQAAPAAPAAKQAAPAAVAVPSARPSVSAAALQRAVAPRRYRQEELEDLKAAYEARMRALADADERTQREIPIEEMLQRTADRLFSEGQAETELGGQRQQIYRMVRAVPALGGLMSQPAGKEFYSPSLPDDPEVFLPLRNTLLAEASCLLKALDGPSAEKGWGQAGPETLCAGWYALTRLAPACENGTPFYETAALLKGFFEKNSACRHWLRENFESADGKEPL